MRILYPGIGLTTFRNHRSKIGIGNYIHPWRRSYLAGRGINYIFFSICTITADAIVKNKIICCRNRSKHGGMEPARSEIRNIAFWFATPVHLFFQRAQFIRNDDMRYCLKKDAIFIRDLICCPYKNTTGVFFTITGKSRCHQALNVVV